MKLTTWNSLASRLLFSLVIFNLLFVGGLAYVTTKIVADSYKKQLKETVEEEIAFILPALTDALAEEEREAIVQQLERLGKTATVNGIRLKRDGFSSITVGVPDAPDTLMRLSVPLYQRARSIGVMEVAVSDSTFRAGMGEHLHLLVFSVAVYFFFILILLTLLRRAFLPLKELTRKLEAFDPGRPAPIELGTIRSDEVGMIAAAAKKMSDNIIHHADYMKELNEEIEEGRQHLKEAQQIARMGSWRIDPVTKICAFSDQMYFLLGLENYREALDWERFVTAVAERDRRAFVLAVESTVQTGVPFRLMHKLVDARGRSMHVLTEAKVSHPREGVKIVSGITMDVSEQAENQQTIEKLAFYDPLTNLPNRLLLNDRLQKAMREAERHQEKIGILFLDLDRFKNVNDTLGHTMGDMLLKEVAKRLKSSLRDADTISRIGGDEFIVLLPYVDEEKDVVAVAKKLIAVLQERWELGEKSFFTTTSVGISIYPDHSEDVDTLIKFADTAMYKAKENGRNRYQLYHPSMGEHIARQLQIEHEMREAIGTMEQFELYYQPKVSLSTGAVVGAEALLRWNHPLHGMIMPDTFIPIAENTGMIIPIGEWVMHEAARRIEAWQKEGLVPLKVAVNLSGRQFASPTLLYQVRSVLQKYAIKPQYLEFEVTESVSMINLQESLIVMHRLRNLGVGVHIDDFGTGYSSLAYLKQFPVDTLKIDKAFILNMLEEPDDRTIVESIVSLAQAMGLKTVAEGVESIEHVRVLKKIGVDFGQGMFFSKPIPFAAFDRLYRNNLIRMKKVREK